MFAGWQLVCFVGAMAAGMVGARPQEGEGRPPTKEEIMAMMDCEKPMVRIET